MGLFPSGLRKVTSKALILTFVLLFVLAICTLFPLSPNKAWASLPTPFAPRLRSSCTPEAWASGQWVYQNSTASNATMASMDDALPILGFEGCASSREYYWHLAADRPDQWDRFPGVASWRWVPSSDCADVQAFDREALVRDLVENGGWLLIGDSVTENHFFSLSCLLYPHVRATPNYTGLPFYERHWPQNLYLSPSSPLVESLNPPPGFNITTTPLVTFRRVDLLLSREQLVDLHQDLYDPPLNTHLFSDEAFWSLPPSEYLGIFKRPFPKGNYRTMIVSTAGHWTTGLMNTFYNDKEEGTGIQGVLSFFREAMFKWADEIQAGLNGDTGTRGTGKKRQVIVRAYLSGHEDCHTWREAWTHVHPYNWAPWNWAYIKDFNRVFSEVLSSRSYPDVHFLPIDGPGLLRPDAHSTGDCLHLMSGAGVMEGWTQYIWHYITREIPGKIR